jgi:hypothetical protein
MEKELQVKKYLPIEEKKLIAKGIIYECTEEVNGVVKVDSIQQYLSYVKYMILRHTNLEYTQEDYDKLCSTEYNGTTLLNAIMGYFGEDASECSRILNLMIDDRMQENSMEFIVGRFLSGISEALRDKLEGFDLNSIMPKDIDKDKLVNFLNTYV